MFYNNKLRAEVRDKDSIDSSGNTRDFDKLLDDAIMLDDAIILSDRLRNVFENWDEVESKDKERLWKQMYQARENGENAKDIIDAMIIAYVKKGGG